MKTISRYIMTLALLLTAASGAWAEEKSETISTTTKQAEYTGEHFKITPNIQNDGLMVADLRNYGGGQVFFFVETLDGQNISKLDLQINGIFDTSIDNLSLSSGTKSYDSNTKVLTITNVNDAFVQITLTEGDQYGRVTISSVTYYYEESPSGPEVTWDKTTKTGTFEMPASDVVLTPVYAEATIYQNDGETEKQAYASLKEAFAAVQDGDIIKLDWNVTLTEYLATPSDGDGVKFTLDFNGFVIDNTGGTNYIVIDNGCELTLTDNSTAQTGGLKSQFPIAGSNGGKVIFQGGRYSFSGCSSQEIALEWDGLVSTYGWVMGDGKEFVDLNNGQPDDDGFMVRVDWKAIELTIGPGRFATFYSDQNTTLADGTDANIGLYTINGEGIDLANNTVTVTKVNDPIAIAGMPLLVYNGTTEQKTVKLKVTPVAPTAGQMWSSHFQGTATDKTFDADDMAKADYYALSGGKAFAPVKGAGTLGANQCWLQFDKQEIPSARQFTLVFDSEATGVSEKGIVNSEKFATATWYDLNGRKIAAPTKKGIYIMNGKKVVVK